jgi:hypothetical protein
MSTTWRACSSWAAKCGLDHGREEKALPADAKHEDRAGAGPGPGPVRRYAAPAQGVGKRHEEDGLWRPWLSC